MDARYYTGNTFLKCVHVILSCACHVHVQIITDYDIQGYAFPLITMSFMGIVNVHAIS